MQNVRAAYEAVLATCDSEGVIRVPSGIEVIQAALGCSRAYAVQLSAALSQNFGLLRRWPKKRDCWQLLPWNVSDEDLKALHYNRPTSFMRAEKERQHKEYAALHQSYTWVYQHVLASSVWTYIRPGKPLVTFSVGRVKPDTRFRSAGGMRLRVHLTKAIPFEGELLPTHVYVEPAATLKEIAGHAFFLLATSTPARLKRL